MYENKRGTAANSKNLGLSREPKMQVLAGDFNIKPFDATYAMLTAGAHTPRRAHTTFCSLSLAVGSEFISPLVRARVARALTIRAAPGEMPSEFAEYAPPPQQRFTLTDGSPFEARLPSPLVSAYRAADGSEPAFTNFAFTKWSTEMFMETLDYVFVSTTPVAGQAPAQDWLVRGVKGLPLKNDTDLEKPFPTKDEPSDHILIAADLSLVSAKAK